MVVTICATRTQKLEELFPRQLRVYIAAPYGRRINNSDEQCESNVLTVIKAARHLILLGHIPLAANLYHYVHKNWEQSPDEDTWLRICMTWVPCCDVLLRLPGKSHGADAEVKLATDLGIRVVYSFEELGKI